MIPAGTKYFVIYFLTSHLEVYMAFFDILVWQPTWQSILAFYLASILTFHSATLSGIHLFYWGGSAHWDLEVAVEVPRCPLRSGARGWGPAVPTEIWSSRLRFRSAHWDLEVAVEVQQCLLEDLELADEVPSTPLRSRVRGWGLAVPTEIWSSPFRFGSAHSDLELAVELAVEVRRCPLSSGARKKGGDGRRTYLW